MRKVREDVLSEHFPLSCVGEYFELGAKHKLLFGPTNRATEVVRVLPTAPVHPRKVLRQKDYLWTLRRSISDLSTHAHTVSTVSTILL